MKIPKNKALKLIDEKIMQFQKVLEQATYDNRYNEDYELAYHGAETLLTELFSEEEAMNFRTNVSSMVAIIGREIDYAKELQDYKKHISDCITQLKVYRERIQNFWEEPTISEKPTDWISQMDNYNFLGIYDVMLDIKQELNISPNRIIIPLFQNRIKFTELFPVDSINMRDNYCGIRWKATEFLKAKGIIKDFELLESSHHWEHELQIILEKEIFEETLERMTLEYKRRTQNQGERVPMEIGRIIKTTPTIPFVAMSFDDSDREINEYVTSVLDALGTNYETGERYSKDSVPEKVKKRILDCNPFIVIFVKRDKIESGGYTTPSWLLKELGIAQGSGKDIIAWVEKDIDPKYIAGLNYEKEIIYFERDNVKEIKKATIKFLEALKEHKLI